MRRFCFDVPGYVDVYVFRLASASSDAGEACGVCVLSTFWNFPR